MTFKLRFTLDCPLTTPAVSGCGAGWECAARVSITQRIFRYCPWAFVIPVRARAATFRLGRNAPSYDKASYWRNSAMCS